MVVLADIIDYISQSPIISVIFAGLITVIIIMKSLISRRFLLTRFIISAILTFGAVLFMIFKDQILNTNKDGLIIFMYLTLIGIEVASFVLLFTVVDLSFSSENFQRELKKSINDTKMYVILNKKDKVKEISTFFLKDLGIEEEEAIGKNIFDVIENKYRLIRLNDSGCLKADMKKFYHKYWKRANPESPVSNLELGIQLDDGSEDALYFSETCIFRGNKYKGRILFGERKTEDNLIGLEKSELEAKNELKLINDRFVTIIEKATDGIFFNTLTTDTIWFNDVLVKKLFLNGNTVSGSEFFKNVHPDDFKVYKEKISELSSGDYHLSYRYNTGNYYVYIKEDGKKIVSKDSIELCGVITVVNDYSFEKTGTVLDEVGTEDMLLNKLKELYSEERIYELVHFKITSIPEINEKYGRPIGNMCMSQYVELFRNQFVDENLIYRVNGLEFVAVITAYNRMESLKSCLRNEEKILHPSMNYINDKIRIDINMGIVVSNEAPNPSECLKCAKSALNYSLNPKYTSSYVFYKDMRYNG